MSFSKPEGDGGRSRFPRDSLALRLESMLEEVAPVRASVKRKQPPLDAGASSSEKKKQITLCDKYKACVFAKECSICFEKDNSPDPVTPSQNRLWGYYKIVLKDAVGNEVEVGTYGTDGATCFYF